MSEIRADSPASVVQVMTKSQPEGWSCARWFRLIALIFVAHVALIFTFGGYKPVVSRVVKNVPALRLADNSNELFALNDPALFALPNPKDFASTVWSQPADVKQPSFHWTEPPRWLELSANKLGMAFAQFMRTNHFATIPFQSKPLPELSAPTLPIEPALAQISTLQIKGDLAQRRLLNQINLPSLPYNDVIAPSKVQALVDAAGNVVSVILLPSGNPAEAAAHDDAADQRALALARTARFAPSTRLTFGQMIFNWHTVATPATNASVTPQ